MEEFQERVIVEKKELDEKRAKLHDFFNTSLFRSLGKHQKRQLFKQDGYMGCYSAVLAERIADFYC